MNTNTLGDRIRVLREERGYTKAELMKELSIHNLGRFENNERIPGADILIILSKFFRVSIDFLLTGEEFNSTIHSENALVLSPEEIRIINLLRAIPDRERTKIEGMLELKVVETEESKNTASNSSVYRTGKGEEAATRELA